MGNLLSGEYLRQLFCPARRVLGRNDAQADIVALALDQVPAKLDSWLLLHNIRIALALAASVLGIVATTR